MSRVNTPFSVGDVIATPYFNVDGTLRGTYHDLVVDVFPDVDGDMLVCERAGSDGTIHYKHSDVVTWDVAQGHATVERVER